MVRQAHHEPNGKDKGLLSVAEGLTAVPRTEQHKPFVLSLSKDMTRYFKCWPWIR
jgi:hypothetical protein